MNKKDFKTLEEQLQIFEKKGLTINDREKAKEILLRENYFFINGYRFIFMTKSLDKKFAISKSIFLFFNMLHIYFIVFSTEKTNCKYTILFWYLQAVGDWHLTKMNKSELG